VRKSLRKPTTKPTTNAGAMPDNATAGPLAHTASRRSFMAVIGVGAAGAAMVACSKDSATTTTGSTTTVAGATPTTTAAGANNDLATAAVAAGLEVLAVQTYGAALAAATANKLGAVPPAVAEYVTTAKKHHQDALDKWNGVLKAGGKPEVSAPDAKLKPTVDSEFAKVTDIGGAAKLALLLEQTAAATYQKVIPTLVSKDAIGLAGSIQVIDAQHVAVLLFVLGQYPVPDTFAKLDKAAA
jgi:hypothetical protein